MKRVLVIGGSMFTGRVFSIQASRDGGFDLHVLNRGNYPMQLERVSLYKWDRHGPVDAAGIVPDISFDALVDFCAYNPGEITPVIKALGGRIKQYIFFSTASIYVPRNGFLNEDDSILDMSATMQDPTVEYIAGKIQLERELTQACAEAGINYTILRPTFIYGPFNYAPREPYFIEMIAKKRPVPFPVDATSRFNFVYALDIARVLMAAVGDLRAFNEAFNLAGTEVLTYPLLMSCFEMCNNGPFLTRNVTSAQADEERIPLPFPLVDDILVDGGKFRRVFDFSYTPFQEGMEKTFKIFYPIYADQSGRS